MTTPSEPPCEHPSCQACRLARREPWPAEAWWMAICDCHPELPEQWRNAIRVEMASVVAAFRRGDDLTDDRWMS